MILILFENSHNVFSLTDNVVNGVNNKSLTKVLWLSETNHGIFIKKTKVYCYNDWKFDEKEFLIKYVINIWDFEFYIFYRLLKIIMK